MRTARLGLPVRSGTHRITSGFGPRSGTQHRGIDFASVTPGKDYTGADILAAEDGVVIESRGASKPGEAGWVGGFGSWVIIEHVIDGQKIHTVSGHMYPKDLLVRVGEKVTRGQRIARVGNNGDSSGAHLHFEVWVGGRYSGTAVDPALWLS